MTGPVFVDTNLLVYAHQSGELLKQPVARDWLEKLWTQSTGRTSVQVLNEYYVCLTRKVRPALAADTAWDMVSSFFSWNPQPIDADVLLRAREIERRYRLSWWDSLIVSAAQIQGCVMLLTEDLHDGAVYGGVKVRNPFTLAVSEPEAEYVVTPAAVSRYRHRGRPRRNKASGAD
jgi:predicted nucleic acid-binding protein